MSDEHCECGTGSQPVSRPQGGRFAAADGLENPSHIEYTCPMHPEVVRAEPGACPICGMALEPRTATLDDAPNHELVDMRRRFIVSAVLSAPLLVAMVFHFPHWLELVLAAPVVLWGGWPFFVRGWVSVVNRQLNMFTLIAMGTSTAFLYS